MRLLRRVAFGCVDSLPRWKLVASAGAYIKRGVSASNGWTVDSAPSPGLQPGALNRSANSPKSKAGERRANPLFPSLSFYQ